MTYFTPGIDKYLANWILKDTWHTWQDIETRFYLFVFAIYKLSRKVKVHEYQEDDPALSHLPERLRKSKKFRCVYERNPRTCNKDGFKKTVHKAIMNNHPNFDNDYAQSLVNELADKAMLILDALHYVEKSGGCPNYWIRENDKLLKILK